MGKSLVGNRGGKRVVLWGRVCARGLDAALGAFVIFLIVTCVVGASTEAPFFETWWGSHLFILLPGFLAPAVLGTAVLPMFRWLRLPLGQLPDLDADSGSASVEDRRERRIARRGLVALVAVVVVPVLVGIFYLEENERGERAWKQYKQQQEAGGVRLEPASLVPPPVPDNQNFASTPLLAPLFDLAPGTLQPRDPGAAERIGNSTPRFDAASVALKAASAPRSNSWVLAQTDLLAWYAAYHKPKDVPVPEDEPTRAFRKRYGLPPPQPAATLAQASTNNAPLPTNVPTLVEAAAGVLAELAEAEPVLEQLRTASLRPRSRFNIAYTTDNPIEVPLPHCSALKLFCRILQLRASAELALGRTEPAFDDINLIFRLTDASRDEPFLISHLVRITVLHSSLQPLAEGLARHQWSEAQLRALEDRLRQFDFCADGRFALEGERAFFGGGFIDFLRRSPNRYRALQGIDGITRVGDGSPVSWESVLFAAVPSGWFYLEKLKYSRMFDDCFLPSIDVPGHRVSPDQCRKTDDLLSTAFSKPRMILALRHQYFSSFLLPALSRAVQKVAFAQAGADAAALACALERYRLAHGEFPESLDALAPEFIAQLPHDVINGQPLKYRRAADGQYLLYSVGWNQTDDGGLPGLTENGKATDQKTGDWAWRLPLPAEP